MTTAIEKTIGITRLGQIQIPTHDVERAANFYEQVLGLKLLFKAPPGLAFFDCGGVRLMLDRPEKPEFDHPSSILYFAVPDIQVASRHHEREGREVRRRAAPDRQNARPRSVDDILPRL